MKEIKKRGRNDRVEIFGNSPIVMGKEGEEKGAWESAKEGKKEGEGEGAITRANLKDFLSRKEMSQR